MSDDFEHFLAEELRTDPEFRQAWRSGELAIALGSEIKALRMTRGLSVADLAGAVGLPEERLIAIELGTDPNVTLGTMGKIVERLGAKATVELQDAPSEPLR